MCRALHRRKKQMNELEKFITERFGDLLEDGELEMLKTPESFEQLKATLIKRAREVRLPVRNPLSA